MTSATSAGGQSATHSRNAPKLLASIMLLISGMRILPTISERCVEQTPVEFYHSHLLSATGERCSHGALSPCQSTPRQSGAGYSSALGIWAKSSEDTSRCLRY